MVAAVLPSSTVVVVVVVCILCEVVLSIPATNLALCDEGLASVASKLLFLEIASILDSCSISGSLASLVVLR